MPEVRFTLPSFFMADLRKDAEHGRVLEKIVRVALMTESGPGPVRDLVVVVSYAWVVAEVVVKLRARVGEDLGETSEALQRAQGLMTQIRMEAENLGLEVQGGEYVAGGGQ
jgi:hypothetical protein